MTIHSYDGSNIDRTLDESMSQLLHPRHKDAEHSKSTFSTPRQDSSQSFDIFNIKQKGVNIIVNTDQEKDTDTAEDLRAKRKITAKQQVESNKKWAKQIQKYQTSHRVKQIHDFKGQKLTDPII